MSALRQVFSSLFFHWRKPIDRCASVADFRRLASRRMPRGCFDYFDGAADAERTVQANRDAYNQVQFRPRMLASLSLPIDTSTTLLNWPLKTPMICSPTGFSRIAHPLGEVAVAQAARRAHIPFTLSSLSTSSIEDVAEASLDNLRFWQVYLWKDRDLVLDMVERAKQCKYSALFLTVDTPVFGRRERDVRSGFQLPPKLSPSTIIDGILHPAWTLDFLRSEPIIFENIARSRDRLASRRAAQDSTPPDGREAVTLAEYINDQFYSSLGWDDVRWLRKQWQGPLFLKGVQTVEDALLAAESGLVQGIVLSNHGGRQLDDSPEPLFLLPEVVVALRERGISRDDFAVLIDGGIQRGSDVVKAIALGANAVMFGRSYLYALGAGGPEGCDRLFSIFQDDIERSLALLGCSSLEELRADHVKIIR